MRARGPVLPMTVLVLAACAEAPPPRPPPPPEAAAPAARAPDLSPLPEPKSLLAVARWKSPTKGMDRALALLGVPLSLEAMLMKEAPEVVSAIQLDASLDLAVSLDPSTADDDPKVFAAASIPLASFERARAAAEKRGALEEIGPGVVRLAPKGEGKARCDIALAAGDAPARLVCGADARSLDALRPWMTRGLPRTPSGPDDLTATLRFRPLQDRFLPPLRKQAADGGAAARAFLAKEGVQDPDLLSVPDVVIDEGLRFFDDLDRIDLRTGLSAQPPELVAGASLRFAKKTSWLTREITDASGHAQPAPPTFWRLPKDASSASWGQSQDPHRFDGIRLVFHKAIATLLERAPVAAADKKAVLALWDGMPRTEGPWVSAQGLLQPATRPLDKAKRTPAEALADAKTYATSALGWSLAGVHGPSADYVAWAKLGVDVYQRGVRFVRQKATSPKDREMLAFIPTVTTSTSPAGWPKGTVTFDLVVTFDEEIGTLFLPRLKETPKPGEAAKKKVRGPKANLTVRLAIVPDGDDTWIGLSADLPALQKRMTAAMTGAPEAGTIAAREGLAALRGSGSTWAGFFSLGDAAESALETVKREKPGETQALEALFAALPNRGKTPILVLGSGTGGNAPSSSAEVRLQQGTLVDIAGLAAFLASERGKKLLDGVKP